MLATRQKPEAFAWSPPAIEFKGCIVAEYAHYFDPSSTNGQPRLDFFTIADIFSKPSHSLTSNQQSVRCEYKFNELSWVPIISDSHPSGLIFGGTENGAVVFIDAHKLVHSSSLFVISSRRDHQGHVLSVDYSSDNRWAISGGGAAQLLLWDLTNLATPFSPGTPNYSDQVKRVRWNKSMSNIVVSLSSYRGSLWDMRRPGGPILEFAEIRSGCDWADVCWKPDDSSTLIMCNQLGQSSGVQKWDLRYPNAPVNQFSDGGGVTAIDWHQKDPRLVVCAGNDRYLRVLNPDTFEVLGGVQIQQNDKVRGVTWSQTNPDLLAVQYYQHPTEFCSIESGGQNASVGRLDVGVVPAWVSAAPVGASFAKGGRMATHYKIWDDSKQVWRYTIEVKKLPVDEVLYESAMELQNARDSKSLGSYCEDRAHGTNDRYLQLLWTFLAALSNKQGRREFVRILGFGTNDPSTKEARASKTSVTSNEVTQLTNIMSLNDSSRKQNGGGTNSVSDDTESDEPFARQKPLDWAQLDGEAWATLDTLIGESEDAVVEQLLSQKDYATAFMLARDNHYLMRCVVERYIGEELAAPQRLLALIATDSFDQLIETFPREEWPRLLALVLSRTGQARLVHTMQKIAAKWVSDGGRDSIHAAFAAILAQDVNLLLVSNRCYSLEERMKQAIVLRSLTGAEMNEEFEELLCKYCENLIAGGVCDAAWRILSGVKTRNERLLSLRHDLFIICGGEERTMSKEPENPRAKYAQNIRNALSPTSVHRRTPVFTPSSAASYRSYAEPSRPFNPPPVSGMPPMPPAYSSATYTGYPPTPTLNVAQPQLVTGFQQVSAGGVPTPHPPVPGPPPMSAFQSPSITSFVPTPPPPSVPGPPPVPGLQQSSGPAYGAPPVVPGFNPIQTPLPPPPSAPLSADPSNTYNYAHGHMHQTNPSHSAPVVHPQDYSSSINRSSTGISPSGVGGDSVAQDGAYAWNDPPPIAARKPTPTAAPVLEVSWKPVEPEQLVAHNGLPGVASGAPVRPSSSASHHNPDYREVPQVTLTPEDQAIVDRFQQLMDAILAVNRTPAAIHKIEEAKARLSCELAPRLATGKLSLAIRQLLWQCGELSAQGNYRAAVATCGQMVRTGGNFVEVSAFLPALKSLFSLAQSTFARDGHSTDNCQSCGIWLSIRDAKHR